MESQSFTAPVELLDNASAKAADLKISRSELIRRAITDFLARHEAAEAKSA
jgi:metal-responsive CopG/Arc/MetJ family transcriptional regulator